MPTTQECELFCRALSDETVLSLSEERLFSLLAFLPDNSPEFGKGALVRIVSTVIGKPCSVVGGKRVTYSIYRSVRGGLYVLFTKSELVQEFCNDDHEGCQRRTLNYSCSLCGQSHQYQELNAISHDLMDADRYTVCIRCMKKAPRNIQRKTAYRRDWDEYNVKGLTQASDLLKARSGM